jgi:hypothetical protein
LYDWLRQEGLRITDDGYIIGYKAVRKDSEGNLRSITGGPAIVDGKRHESGPVLNNVGCTVEMPRSRVQHDPSNACSSGLHVATRQYAEYFGGESAHIVEIHTNPRDVVSVPTDGGGEKVRVCRYRVAAVVRTPLVATNDYRYW